MKFIVGILSFVWATSSCAAKKRIDVPDHLRSTGNHVQPPYAVRLVDNERTWNVWLPPVSGGYEVRIPIGKGDAIAGAEAKGPAILTQDSTEFRAAMARVTGLFQRKSYDLALLELSRLRADFPDDAKLLAMEGTLHMKMGDKKRAQASWERALEIDPANDTVLNMLEELK
jgi:tetratricopeptide (TPR) repeat protein